MRKIVIALFSIIFCTNLYAQQTITEKLTFAQVIELARQQSPNAIMAKHQFRANYWSYVTYKSELLPQVKLSTVFPSLDRSFKEFTDSTGARYIRYNQNTSSVDVNVTQNVPFTGGQLSVNTSLLRLDNLGSKSHSYSSTPVLIRYNQPMLFFNEYKWKHKIEPLKYEEAKKKYILAMEEVSLKAVGYFFDLALAQQNLQVSQLNYSNADTLYKIATGRYKIGTIAENELMQMELSFLNAGSSLNSAKLDLEVKKFQLRSFLGFNEKIDLHLIIPKEIPQITVDVNEALDLAMQNNPSMLSFDRQLIETERDLARARSQRRLQASIDASVGYTQQARDIHDVYLNPQERQTIRLALEIPLLDWKRGKGRYKMAESNRELALVNVKQGKVDFQQNVYLNVMQFNLQDDQLMIAAKSDTIAQKRYDITKQRFLIGKVDVLDLNVALKEKDESKNAYISALRQYWTNYYALRKITLFDFVENKELTADFDNLIK